MKKWKIIAWFAVAAAFVFVYPRNHSPKQSPPIAAESSTVMQSPDQMPEQTPDNSGRQSASSELIATKGITLRADVVATFAPDKKTNVNSLTN